MTESERNLDRSLEQMIAEWRTRLRKSGEQPGVTDAREESLRGHFSALTGGDALGPGERFLIAARRAEEEPAASGESSVRSPRADFAVMVLCALLAAVAAKTPSLLGASIDEGDFYLLNISFLVLPFLGAYLAWRRQLGWRHAAAILLLATSSLLAVNLYPFETFGSTQVLTAIHLPIAMWLLMGVAHAGGDWRSRQRRMDYVRFTGEWFVNFVLVALGGGVLMALTIGTFEAIGLDASQFVENWALPCGAAGAVIVAGWLAESRRSLAGGMAPMLARVFSPLFAVLLVALVTGVALSRGVVNIERDVLLIFDLLLVIVLALLLYGVSSRVASDGAGVFDWIQLVLVAGALLVDMVVLVNMFGRLAEFGLSPNRVAVIGLNIVLLVSLIRSATLQLSFVRGRHGIAKVEAWHMDYLPVYAGWAAAVALLLPILFAFA